MRHARRRVVALAGTLLLAAGSARAADVEAGRRKAMPCAECHGSQGNSTDPAVPNIAGQPAKFLSTQLFLFREDYRRDEKMSPAAKPLSNRDMEDVAAYFASIPPAPPQHRTAPQNAQLGSELARKFRCVECHSSGLQGQQHVPRIAGQQPDYLRAQLKAFKRGARSDIDGYMTQMAQPLSDADIEILTDYLAGLGQSAAAGASR